MRFKRHPNSVFQHNWFQISFLPITNICLTLPAPDTILAESPKSKCSYSGAEKGVLQSPPPPSVPQVTPGLLRPPQRDMMCWSLTHTRPLPLLSSPLNLKSHSSGSSLKSVARDTLPRTSTKSSCWSWLPTFVSSPHLQRLDAGFPPPATPLASQCKRTSWEAPHSHSNRKHSSEEAARLDKPSVTIKTNALAHTSFLVIRSEISQDS